MPTSTRSFIVLLTLVCFCCICRIESVHAMTEAHGRRTLSTDAGSNGLHMRRLDMRKRAVFVKRKKHCLNVDGGEAPCSDITLEAGCYTADGKEVDCPDDISGMPFLGCDPDDVECNGYDNADSYDTSADNYDTSSADNYDPSADQYGADYAPADDYSTAAADQYATQDDGYGYSNDDYSSLQSPQDANFAFAPDLSGYGGGLSSGLQIDPTGIANGVVSGMLGFLGNLLSLGLSLTGVGGTGK